MSEAILADAQFTTATFFYPFDTFDTVYQGKKAFIPLPLSPDGQAFDENAGAAGYNPTLANGMRVPFGSRFVLWLPHLLATSGGVSVPYIYTISPRIRNIADYQRDKKGGFRMAVKTGLASRVIIPAGAPTIVYNQVEAATGVPTVNHLRMEQILADGPSTAGASFGPGNVALAYQQGVGGLASTDAPAFLPYDIHALGDEIFIQVSRDATVGANWDFFGADAVFGAYYATRGVTRQVIGAFAMTGSSP